MTTGMLQNRSENPVIKKGRICRLAAIVLLFLVAMPAGISCSTAGRSSRSPDQVQTADGLYVVGHRGAAGLAPENTLASFRKACELGVNAVELDVLMTLDRKIVVHHDYFLSPEIARTPDGKWLQAHGAAINTLTLDELKYYDIGRLKPGTRYAKRYPVQQPTDGERIPTLDEVVALIKAACSRETELWVEIKTTPQKPALTPAPEVVVDGVVGLLQSQALGGRARILSFDWRALAHVQKTAPDIPTVYLSIDGVRFNTIEPGRPGASPWMAGLDIDDFNGSVPQAVRAAGGRYWAPYHRDATYQNIQEAHKLGLLVYAWTPDTRSRMQLLLEKGVDGIITNRPDILKRVIRGD